MSTWVDFKEVKENVSMEQALQYLGIAGLKPRGKEQVAGPCPLCGNETRSFVANQVKNVFHCFKCKAGGNIITLVEMMKGISFRDAALALQAQFLGEPTNNPNVEEPTERGRKVDQDHDKSEGEDHQEKTKTAEGPGKGKAPTSNPVLTLEVERDPAHAEVEKLGYAPEVIDLFELGYCNKGIMRGAIAFPFHNAKGEIVAYVGINTTDSRKEPYRLPGRFHAELEMFNLHRLAPNRPPDDHAVIVVPSYKTLFRLWEQGHRNVVAVPTKDIHEGQRSALLGIASRLILLADPEAEGQALQWQQQLITDAFIHLPSAEVLTRMRDLEWAGDTFADDEAAQISAYLSLSS